MQLDIKKGSRAQLLAGIIIAIMIIFVVRLFYLQIIRHDYYVGLANKEQLKQLTIPASRGEIYALDDGRPVKLVLNETVYTVFADPKIVDEPQKVIDVLRRVAGGNMRPHVDSLLAKRETRYQIIATKVTRKQAELIKKEELRGVGFQKVNQRVYPEAGLAAQTLGFVDDEGEGKYGVEGGLNDRLKGTDGLLQSVTDVSNVPLTIGDNNVNTPAKNGDNVVLTIDRNIQAYAEKALAAGLKRTGATNGSVMIIDPQTGHVQAMANLPSYKPADFTKVTNAAVFNNDTVSTPYEAGSDIKTLTVATGIDAGAIEPDSTYVNTDYIKVGDRTIQNATKGQTGRISMQHALNYSLNTGMVTIAQRLGDGREINFEARNKIYSYFHDKFGLGIKTGIEVANEASGTVIPPTDPDGGAVRYSNMTFGQGMDVTMVQVCAAFSTIINGGVFHPPTVVAGTMSDDGETFTSAPEKAARTSVISRESSDKVRTMVHNARAVFYATKDRPGYYIGGKTGTSQVLRNGKYVFDETVGTYLGFGGNSKTTPKYVIMVQLSAKGKFLAGNYHALPIFTDISNWMLNYLKLPPKG